MKNIVLVLFAAGVVAIGYYFIGTFGAQDEAPAIELSSSPQQPASGSKQMETKTNDQPPVVIEVTPLALGAADAAWEFQITFTTHSGSLDDDPMQVAVLVDDEGREYKPIRWEGPGPGGHHREGILVFNAIEPLPEYIDLTIRNVGSVAERTFRWDIK